MANFESKIFNNNVRFLQEIRFFVQFSYTFIWSFLRDSLVLKESLESLAMRPKQRKDSGGGDLFRSRLGQIVDMNHWIAKLPGLIDWKFLDEALGSVYRDAPGRPP